MLPSTLMPSDLDGVTGNNEDGSHQENTTMTETNESFGPNIGSISDFSPHSQDEEWTLLSEDDAPLEIALDPAHNAVGKSQLNVIQRRSQR